MRILSLAFALTVSLPAALAAQRSIMIEVRPNFAIPIGKLAGTRLDVGTAFGATASIRLQQHLHLYGGWDWAHFGADNSFAGSKLEFEETGYDLGLRYEHPCRMHTDLAVRVEAGGTWKHVEIENAAGQIVADSKHSLGYEAAFGLAWSLSEEWKLVPMARYRSLSPEFTIGSTTTSGNLRYAAVEFTLSRSFR